MVTFFRRIRNSLIESGSTSKYIFYALGEIALVVVGILIALQINNWNEKRKTSEHELRLLQGLHNAMEDDIQGWNFIMMRNRECNTSYNIIIGHLNGKLPYSDSLGRHFNQAEFWWYHPLNKSAFETAKIYGLNFIENDDLVYQISDLYQRLHGIYDDVKEYMEDFHFAVAASFSTDHFAKRQIGEKNHLVPLKYEALLDDHKYHNIINTKWITRKNLLNWQERMLERMQLTMELLQEEMKKYE